MFYLEDFLEKLEVLPQDIRISTTEIGKLDLKIENSMNCIKNNVDTIFSKANTMNPDDLNDNFKAIMKQRDNVLEQSDKKIELTNNMQNIISKYLNRLDLELQEFKTDLEVDKTGITELIEKRILDSDQINTTNHKENKYETNRYIFGDTEELLNNIGSVTQKSIEVASDSISEDLVPYFQPDTSPVNSQMDTFPSSFIMDMGAGCSAIAEVVSKAIVFTQKSSQGHESTSFIASLDETCNDQIKDKSDCLLPIKSNKNQTKKNKKLRRGIVCKKISTKKDESMDSNETRYCLCNEIAYGTMVACDNRRCPHEWFHYACVGITKQPHGKWYCPKCVIKLKRKR